MYARRITGHAHELIYFLDIDAIAGHFLLAEERVLTIQATLTGARPPLASRLISLIYWPTTLLPPHTFTSMHGHAPLRHESRACRAKNDDTLTY